MPTKYRAALTPMVVAPNPMPDEPCLLIYPTEVWKKVEADISARPKTKPNRQVMRKFLGAAEDVAMDSGGRVLIKPDFREQLGLEKKVLLVGQGNKLELWGEAEWEAFNNDDTDEAAFIAELEELIY